MMSYTIMLTLLFEVLVFPGGLFLFVLALLSEWWVRKVVARAQNRMGPSYVGPAGILQPFADFLKLIYSKEEIRQKYSTLNLAKLFAFLGLGSLIAVLALLPIAPLRLEAGYDIIALSYFCCVWVPLSIVVMGLSTPNPFTGAGVSRLLSLYAVCEPAYFMSILVPATLVTRLYHPVTPYSVLSTSMMSWGLWLNPLSAVLMALAFIGVTVSTQAKSMAQPFNIPEAEQELIAGPMTEFSGPLLALNNLLHDADIAVTLLITTYLLLGGPYPYPHLSIAGAVTVTAKYLGLLTLMAFIKSIFGRLRVEQAVTTLLKYSLLPSLIALVGAMLL